MAHDSHAPQTEPAVPPELLATRKADWHIFTRSIVANCVATAAVLVFLLLVFKIF
jgi:hypothetical protein